MAEQIIHYMKQHDTAPPLEHQLTEDVTVGGITSNTPVDLTGATVTCNLRVQGSASPLVSRGATIVDAVVGRVRFDWQPSDTVTTGTLEGEWQVTGGTVGKRTFPARRAENFLVIIDGDIDGV